MKLLIQLIATMLLLSACDGQIIIASSQQQYQVTRLDVSNSDYIQVDMINIATKLPFKNIQVRKKGCTNLEQLQIGTVFTFTEVLYERGYGYSTTVEGTETLCALLAPSPESIGQ